MKPPILVKTLCILHFLLGIGAVFGGVAFMVDPSGELLGIPIRLLEDAPFTNYLLPGIILFYLFGILPIYLSIAIGRLSRNILFNRINIFKDKHWSWVFSLYVGFAICIWIFIQVYIISEMHAVHLLYFFWGISIQIITLLPKSQKWFISPIEK